MLMNIARTERLQRSNFADLYINVPRQRTTILPDYARNNEGMLGTRVTDPE